jgi:hypothetical protein
MRTWRNLLWTCGATALTVALLLPATSNSASAFFGYCADIDDCSTGWDCCVTVNPEEPPICVYCTRCEDHFPDPGNCIEPV